MADKNIKRVGLYFNIEDEEDRVLYEYLNKKKKSKYLKRLIEDDIKINNNYSINKLVEVKKDDDLDKLDIDDNFTSF